MLIHRYETPQRFVAGTVGPPGERTFFLQARDGTRITSVALEKQQVEVLAERVGDLLDQVSADAPSIEPISAATSVDDTAPLDQPIEEEFRVGVMTLAWDAESGTVVVEAFASTDGEEKEADEALVVTLPPGLARGFAERAVRVVGAGREPCQFCGGPMDPSGHLCPRSNGYLRTPR